VPDGVTQVDIDDDVARVLSRLGVLLGIVGHDQPDLATAEPMKTREFRLAIVQRTDGVRVLGGLGCSWE
jgi:hypothetical protein